MRYAVLGLVVLIAGCASQQEIAARRAAEQQYQQQQAAAYRNQLSGSCSAMGFQPGTRDHSMCMLQLHQQNQANMGAAAAAAIGGAASRPLPSCRGLPPGIAGYERARGNCQ